MTMKRDVEEIVNKEKAKKSLNKIKLNIEQGIENLKIKVDKINQNVLLKAGTDDIICGLFKVLSAKEFL
jgi:hypothetical protein